MIKKVVARIYRWILLSIILQVAFLMFLNNYVSKSGEFEMTSIDLLGDISNTVKTKLPAKAENIKVSQDGTYLAYMDSGKLVITDLVAEQQVKAIEGKEGTITYYRWLPDRNMVIYSEKLNTSYSGTFKISTYEIDSGIDRDYPLIKNLSKSSKVDAIELSPFTKVSYIKFSNNNGRSVIYKFNIMNHLSWIMETGSNTVIYEAGLSDMLIYQNEKNVIAYRDGSDGSRHTLDFNGKMALLGVDAEDRVFVGELNKDNKISSIRYGKVDEELSSWTTKKLDTPTIAENIHVTRNGSIYFVEANGKNIENILTGKKTKLKGKIVDVINGYIATADGNTFILDELK